MKNLILFIVVIYIFFGFSLANDCDKVGSTDDGAFILTKNWDLDDIVPKEAIDMSLKNLKSFCCENENLDESACGKAPLVQENKIYPMSTSLFDHILDVSMRRLDAKGESEQGDNLIYGLTADTKGDERRKFIIEKANDKNPTVPLVITNKYKEYWDMGNNMLEKWNSNYENKRNGKFDNYPEWTLGERYNSICETTMYIYNNMVSDSNNEGLANAYYNCRSLAQNRMKKELEYTNAIILQKGNKFLENNINSYTDVYFVQNQLTSLQQLIFNIKNTFNEVNKAVIKLVNSCT